MKRRVLGSPGWSLLYVLLPLLAGLLLMLIYSIPRGAVIGFGIVLLGSSIIMVRHKQNKNRCTTVAGLILIFVGVGLIVLGWVVSAD
jgi:hypothetical protein